jgi:long-chain-fatty-acid--CoA ligase ACSBG
LRGDVPAMRVMRKNKEYIWTWIQYYSDTLSFAKTLHFLGVDERSCVNIMGFNSPEWAISFYGGILHNNVSSGIYTTNGAEACFY